MVHTRHGMHRQFHCRVSVSLILLHGLLANNVGAQFWVRVYRRVSLLNDSMTSDKYNPPPEIKVKISQCSPMVNDLYFVGYFWSDASQSGEFRMRLFVFHVLNLLEPIQATLLFNFNRWPMNKFCSIAKWCGAKLLFNLITNTFRQERHIKTKTLHLPLDPLIHRNSGMRNRQCHWYHRFLAHSSYTIFQPDLIC